MIIDNLGIFLSLRSSHFPIIPKCYVPCLSLGWFESDLEVYPRCGTCKVTLMLKSVHENSRVKQGMKCVPFSGVWTHIYRHQVLLGPLDRPSASPWLMPGWLGVRLKRLGRSGAQSQCWASCPSPDHKV